MRTSIVLALLVALALPASAQRGARSNTDGLFLQIALDAQGLRYDGETFDDEDEGSGASVRVGYGISPGFTLYGGLAGSRIESERGGEYALGAGELGARFNFNEGRRLRPYFDVALRGVVARDDDLDFELSGGELALGGGVAYFLSPTVAIDASLKLGGGEFEEVQFGRLAVDLDDEDLRFGEARVSVGLTTYPFRERNRRHRWR